MGYCCQNETESQSHQMRSFLALQINMNQAKPQLEPEFETCFECRPSTTVLTIEPIEDAGNGQIWCRGWVLSKRRSRRSRTFIDWSGRPWLADVLFEPSITAAIGGSAHIGWAAITKVRFVCCAISMVGRVAVDCKRPTHRQTGAVLRWRNSAEWSCSKAHGTQRPTITAHRPASRK